MHVNIHTYMKSPYCGIAFMTSRCFDVDGPVGRMWAEQYG